MSYFDYLLAFIIEPLTETRVLYTFLICVIHLRWNHEHENNKGAPGAYAPVKRLLLRWHQSYSSAKKKMVNCSPLNAIQTFPWTWRFRYFRVFHPLVRSALSESQPRTIAVRFREHVNQIHVHRHRLSAVFLVTLLSGGK